MALRQRLFAAQSLVLLPALCWLTTQQLCWLSAERYDCLQVDLQQQVRGMSEQLASLEASLMASDAQAGSLRQELASLSNGPPTFKVNGTGLNGGASANLPKGYYYTLADLSPAGPAAQESAAPQQPESVDPAEGRGSAPGAAASQSEGDVVVPEEQHNTASTADASIPGPGLGREQEKRPDEMAASRSGEGNAVTEDVHSAASEDAGIARSSQSRNQEQKPDEALLAGDGREASSQSFTSSTEQQAAQPGMAVNLCPFTRRRNWHQYHASTRLGAHTQLLENSEGAVNLSRLYLMVIT